MSRNYWPICESCGKPLNVGPPPCKCSHGQALHNMEHKPGRQECSIYACGCGSYRPEAS